MMEILNSCIRDKANPLQINKCRNKVASNEDSFTQLSGILSLTGNEVRLKILYLLHQEKELCPCDLSDILGMSIPAVSQHLRKMKDGNIIEFRREGQTIFYSLKEEHLKLMQPFFDTINQVNLTTETI
jgi:ArsR family transcriptional regulator, lead/cadmium/zinc/bismuth-responsive transcriptional repressor